MAKGTKALRRVRALKAAEQRPPQPIERHVPIARAQAALYTRVKTEIDQLTNQLSAVVAGILAGHGIEAAQQVRLEGDAEHPEFVCLDFTAVQQARELAQRAGPPPPAPEPPPPAPALVKES